MTAVIVMIRLILKDTVRLILKDTVSEKKIN